MKQYKDEVLPQIEAIRDLEAIPQE
jgi:hypothetical protein